MDLRREELKRTERAGRQEKSGGKTERKEGFFFSFLFFNINILMYKKMRILGRRKLGLYSVNAVLQLFPVFSHLWL